MEESVKLEMRESGVFRRGWLEGWSGKGAAFISMAVVYYKVKDRRREREISSSINL